ncbi:MAG: hypothetical protein ACNA8W_06930, partial [Bradymonadaceae bacterium]
MSTNIEPIELLKAGGYLPINAALPDDAAVDDIDARSYIHPALGSRRVIRLTPSALAIGEDSTMEFFGFAATDVVEGIARRQRQSLGFPQWVLVYDPDNGPKAIEVGKKLNRQARLARSKPGAAKDAFDAQGDELARTLPHFLPSYYEQVGRAFLEAGNAAYAATAFGKAREAEHVYALEVDEEHRRESFLEFALAGALTNKVMSAYAQDLAKRYGDGRGYEIFFDLCVRRTLGGTPPHAAMVDQLRRLARTAKLNAAHEDERFVQEIWQAPALARSATRFWKTYRKALIGLCKENYALRGRLLNLFPKPSSGGETFKSEWLDLLEACGALDALSLPADETPVEAHAEGDPARWFDRMAQHSMDRYYWRASYGRPDALFGLLRRIAPRLKADQLSLGFGDDHGYYYDVDIDLLDLALELGLDVKPGGRFNLTSWAESSEGSSERPRDLSFVGSDERFEDMLDCAVGEAFSDDEFQRAARECSGLEMARKKWLERRVEEISQGALPGFEETFGILRHNVFASTFQEFPDLYERVCATDIVPLTARSLRNGLLDEYGWEAFEDVFRGFVERNKNKSRVTVRGSFPHLIVHDEISVCVLGRDGKILDHDLRLPKDSRLNWVVYAGGQVAVGFYDSYWSGHAYWSERPSEHFGVNYYIYPSGIGVELPDGGITFGRKALYAGDTEFHFGGDIYGDGEHFWTVSGDWNKGHLAEFEPRRSTIGRRSLPAFFEEFVTPDKELMYWASALYPLGSTDLRSPLGERDGLYGLRARQLTEEPYTVEYEGIDGRSFLGELSGGHTLTGLLSMPGDDRLRPLGGDDPWHLYEPDGTVPTLGPSHCHSRTSYLPVAFWHYLTVRDEEGSARLRRASDDEVAVLMLASVLEKLADEHQASPRCARLAETISALSERLGAVEMAAKIKKDLEKSAGLWKAVLEGEEAKSSKAQPVEDVIGELLPELTDSGLIESVAAFVGSAAARLIEFGGYLSQQDPARNEAFSGAEVDVVDADLNAALNRFMHTGYYYGEEYSLAEGLAMISAFLFRGEAPGEIKFLRTPWQEILGQEKALAWLAMSPGISDAQSHSLIAFLKLWARMGFLDYEGRFRRVEGKVDDAKKAGFIPADEEAVLWICTHAGNHYMGRINDYYGQREQITLLEYSPEGKFKLLPGTSIAVEYEVAPPTLTSHEIDALELALGSHGPLDYDEARINAFAARTGLTYPEASLVWMGLPNLDSWDKNFLPKELRTQMGLKVAEADVARQSLRRLNSNSWLNFFANAFPEDMTSVFEPNHDEDPFVDNLAQAWIAIFGRRVAVPGCSARFAAGLRFANRRLLPFR